MRALALSDDEVAEQVAVARRTFRPRHKDIEGTWERHFALVEHRLVGTARLDPLRRLLLGAYFTQEFAIEGAALFNPSMVAHPDQSDLPDGSARFLMTMRAVGEGHVSSVEFRTGTIDKAGSVVVDPPASIAVLPSIVPVRYSRASFQQQLSDLDGTHANSDFVLDALPESFDLHDLDVALDVLRDQLLTRGSSTWTVDRLRWIAACTYSVEFAADTAVHERVLMPVAPSESRGMEDVRMLRLTETDGATRYVGTYTAYDGADVTSSLMETTDFRTFRMTQLNGPGAQNKGISLFPRKLGNRYMALSRADRESNSVTTSLDLRHWEQPRVIQAPARPWEIVQLGNCGPPIETDAGWLVLTHGVGPMRQYSIGAMLLDREDPTLVRGALAAPLLTPDEDERDGYVPNVVYSCGAMLHDRTLVLPYGCSDQTTRIALVDLDPLLSALTTPGEMIQ